MPPSLRHSSRLVTSRSLSPNYTLPTVLKLPQECHGGSGDAKSLPLGWKVDTSRLWTLERVIRSVICREQTLRALRNAYQESQGIIRSLPFSDWQLAGRYYPAAWLKQNLLSNLILIYCE
jgi:hypothetical protein